MIAAAYNNGARISTNSWGAAVGGAYTSDAQAYDVSAFVFCYFFFYFFLLARNHFL
jgi:hypothetical protein